MLKTRIALIISGPWSYCLNLWLSGYRFLGLEGINNYSVNQFVFCFIIVHIKINYKTPKFIIKYLFVFVVVNFDETINAAAR